MKGILRSSAWQNGMIAALLVCSLEPRAFAQEDSREHIEELVDSLADEFPQKSARKSSSAAASQSAGSSGSISSDALEGVETSLSRVENAHAASDNHPGRIVFDALSIEKEALLKRAFLQDQVVVLPSQFSSSAENREWEQAWEGNTPDLTVDIPRIILRFRKGAPAPGEPVDPKAPTWFDVIVEFSERDIAIRHSNPRFEGKRAGIRVPAVLPQQARMYFEGEFASGVAVLIPRGAVRGQFSRSLLICPRFLFSHKRGRYVERAFVESSYRLSRLMTSVKGHAKARALSGGRLARAKATVRTTPNVYRSSSFVDETFSVDPSIELSYIPYTSEHLADMDTDGNISAGIQVGVELQREAGFQFNTSLRQVVWVKEIALSKEEAWFIKQPPTREPIRVAPGSCYVILTERRREENFTRRDFILPPRLSG